MELTSDQQDALAEFNEFMLEPKEKVMVIKGYSGTGKTTLLKHILENINSQLKLYSMVMGVNHQWMQVQLTATTNKAARVLADFTGTVPKTIHSLIGLKVTNDYRTGEQKLQKTRDYSVQQNVILVVDEASFVDKQLLKFIEGATLNCKVLYVGDPCQLTPTKSATCPVFDLPVRSVELKEIVRQQDKDSDIVKVSFQYRDALLNKKFPNALFEGNNITCLNNSNIRSTIQDEFLKASKPDDVKVLAWTNNRVHQYNDLIRGFKGYSSGFVTGEQVLTNKPILSAGVSTDSILVITDIKKEQEREGIDGRVVELNNHISIFLPDSQLEVHKVLKHLAKHKDWKKYFHIKENWADLRPLYACTVHKSQGSTYKKVIVDLSDISKCNIWSDVARMLYVGLSRASDEVFIYGSLPAKYSNRSYAPSLAELTY